jgi:hypothetical protein
MCDKYEMKELFEAFNIITEISKTLETNDVIKKYKQSNTCMRTNIPLESFKRVGEYLYKQQMKN